MGAHVVDGLAHGPVRGRGHHLAAHQAAGGVLVILQRGLDGDAVAVVEAFEDLGLLLFLKVLDEVDEVVGLHLLHGGGEDLAVEHLEDLVADAFFQFVEDIAVEIRAPDVEELLALGTGDLFQKVGDVGFVERFEQFDQLVGVLGLHRLEDGIDHRRVQGVYVLVLRFREVGLGQFGFRIVVGHGAIPCGLNASGIAGLGGDATGVGRAARPGRHCATISTRRLSARPSAVALVATGAR